jgi:cobalt-precorrin-7 (C5)-methyltransferase
MIRIVRVGPAKRYLTERAVKTIQEAEVVYGSKRAIELAEDYIRGEKIVLRSFSEEEYSKIVEDGKSRKVVVLSTGDPMVSGLGTKIEGEVEPGVSSIQLALARLRVDLTDVVVVDAHAKKRDEYLPEILNAFKMGRNVLILADSKSDIEALSEISTRVVILENLGKENERVERWSGGALPEIKSDLVIVFAERR